MDDYYTKVIVIVAVYIASEVGLNCHDPSSGNRSTRGLLCTAAFFLKSGHGKSGAVLSQIGR